MNTPHSGLFHRIALGVVLLLILACLCWVLPGITVNFSPQSPLEELKSAESLWKQQHLSDYRMNVSFGSFGFLGSFNFTVQNNTVVKIESTNLLVADNPGSLAINPPWYSNYFDKVLSPNLSSYTMEQLFDFTASKIQSEPTPAVIAWCGTSDRNRYDVTFNKEQGYISSLYYTDCVKFDWGFGLLCPLVSDCALGFTVNSLQPLK